MGPVSLRLVRCIAEISSAVASCNSRRARGCGLSRHLSPAHADTPSILREFDHFHWPLPARALPRHSSDISGMNRGEENYDPAGTKGCYSADRRG